MNRGLRCAGEEVILEYHHPEAQPPAQGFVARIISIMQVGARSPCMHATHGLKRAHGPFILGTWGFIDCFDGISFTDI